MLSGEESSDEGGSITTRLFGLLILGVALVIAGTAILVVVSLFSGGSSSVGGVIFIGPIPIIFGAGRNSTLLITIGAILAVLTVIVFFFMNRKWKKVQTV